MKSEKLKVKLEGNALLLPQGFGKAYDKGDSANLNVRK